MNQQRPSLVGYSMADFPYTIDWEQPNVPKGCGGNRGGGGHGRQNKNSKLRFGNGCRLFKDCFECPFPDCWRGFTSRAQMQKRSD